MAPRKKVARTSTFKSVEYIVDSEEEENDTDHEAACEPTEEDTEKRQELERGDRGSKKYIGAHVSIKDGIWKAVQACKDLGGRSFALFLGSQRAWKRPPLNPTAVAKFQEQCKLQGFDPAHILPHGSYLMNCGSPKLDVFTKSQAMLIDELSRCHTLGLHLYNFHPGSSLGTITTTECVEKIAGAINHAHQQVPTVVTVIENMCGQGQTVGGKFSELRGIIDRVRDDTRVAVCLDTCHAFAAGYDLAAEQGVKTVLDEFDQTVGLRYLKALHLNDSKGALGCHLDRHEDIGKGKIGIAAFQDIVNEPRLDNMPMILETPGRSGFEYPEQIKLLYSLCDTE